MRVDVDRLDMRGTGAIFTLTDGSGRGGDFVLNADSVLIDHDVASRRDTGIWTEAGFGNPDATGDAGDMLATARTVVAVGSDADFASTFTAGQGGGGSVVVNAETVRLLSGGRILGCTEGPGDAHINDALLNAVAQGAVLIDISRQCPSEHTLGLISQRFPTTFRETSERIFMIGGGTRRVLAEREIVLPTGKTVPFDVAGALTRAAALPSEYSLRHVLSS